MLHSVRTISWLLLVAMVGAVGLTSTSAGAPEHITTYDLGGSTSNTRGIIDRIMAAPPRFIVAIGPLAAQVAKAEARGIPVVFLLVRNPRRQGLEGDNIAGISLDVPIEAQLAMYRSLLRRWI